jgi:hypothetical protein
MTASDIVEKLTSGKGSVDSVTLAGTEALEGAGFAIVEGAGFATATRTAASWDSNAMASSSSE